MEAESVKIDFIVTWVDGSDPNWIKKRNEFSPENALLNSKTRYRDYGTFKYWFRAVEKYCPWVHKIFLVTDNQVPDWLNIDHPKLEIIDHKDYIPNQFLPTFNSNSIELNFHRIKKLSENFVLFNDDTFINTAMEESDFFRNNLPCDSKIYSIIVPTQESNYWLFNDVMIINKYFTKSRKSLINNLRFHYGKQIIRSFATLPWKKITGYYDSHIPISYKKSTFQKVWDLENAKLITTSQHKFRTKSDVNHLLMRYWQLESNQFYPRAKIIGKYYDISEFNEIQKDIAHSQHKLICINDSNITNYDKIVNSIIELFNKKYPNKSSFEL